LLNTKRSKEWGGDAKWRKEVGNGVFSGKGVTKKFGAEWRNGDKMTALGG
jgi:hypothetical protein